MAEIPTETIRRLIDEGAERGRQINEILKKQDAMQTSLDSVAKFRLRTEQKIIKHDHVLFGNGEPGMDEVLRNINAWIGEQKAEQSKTKQLDKEVTLMGVKTTAEIKIAIINGFITIAAVVVTAWLSKP